MTIESPCVKRCEVDATRQQCVGCGRVLQEIANWTRYSAGERRRIMQALPARLATLQNTEQTKGNSP